MKGTFDHLLLLGRPASGKSEFIDFMKQTADDERVGVYHLGELCGLDDFFWLWEKFQEDDMWEESGYPRLYSKKNGPNYNVRPEDARIYDFMFAKFNHVIKQKYLSKPEFYENNTLIVEFSRGKENAYKNALSRLSKDVLSKTAILYVNVDFDESWRRNVTRYEEKLRSSSLAHMAPRETMETFYKTDDWQELTSGKEGGFLEFHGLKIPFVTMNNTPELKERGPLAERYRPHLDELYKLFRGER